MRSNEIKMIEKLAENMQGWTDEQSCNHSPTFIRFAPDFGQKEVILWLLSKIPEIGHKVQEDFKVLQEKVCDLNSWSSKPITEAEYNEEFYPRTEEVKSIASDLIETLQQIAKKARKERKRQIIKRIRDIVILFAALLTILHLLGWLELIKASIVKILWPK
ncbi:MAG: hypothetical protein WBL85_04270 [Sedimentisphaerales bacterium]